MQAGCTSFLRVGFLDASPSSQPLLDAGLQSGRLPRISDLPAKLLPLSHAGEPRHRMKSRLKLRHMRGDRRQSLCPRSSTNRGVIPEKGTSAYVSLLLPHEHISQDTASQAPRTAIVGHILQPEWPPDAMTGFLPDTIVFHSTYAPLLTTILSEGNYILLRRMQEMPCGSLSLTVRKTCPKTG